MNPLARAIMMAAASGAAPWTPASIPSQLLRIDAAAGFTLSGTNITAIADQSAAAQTITITGTPQYTASDANLNSQPSFAPSGSSKIVAPNVNRANIAFAAYVTYISALSYVFDGDEFTGRQYNYISTGGGGTLVTRDGSILISGVGATGKKRLLVPMDGSTATKYNGTDYGTLPANTGSGTGVTVGTSHIPANPCTLAFFMLCSAVPSSGDRASLEAYLLARFG